MNITIDDVVKFAPIGCGYFRNIVDDTGTPIDYEFIELNPHFEKLTGWERESVLHKSVSEVTAGCKSDCSYWVKKSGDLAMKNGNDEFEFYSECLKKCFRVKVLSLTNSMFVTYLSEITQTQNGEIEILKQQEQLRLAMNAGEQGFWDYDIKERCMYFSPGFYTMLGYSPNEFPMSLNNYKALLHPTDRNIISTDLLRHVNSGSSFSYEFRLKCKDDAYRWFASRGKAVTFDSNNKPIRIVGVQTDIDSIKSTEKMLEISEKKYRSIIENMSDVYYRTDNNGKMCIISPSGVSLLGYDSMDEVIGLDIAKDIYVDPSKRNSFIEALKNNGGKITEYEVDIKRKDGNSLTILASSTFYYNDNGDVQGIEGVLTDITKLKNSEYELRRAKEDAEAASLAKTDFLANMSHEIRTPLNGIIGFTTLLDNSELTDIQKQYVKIINSSADSLLSIINDILDFSKIEAGKLDIEPVQVDILELLEQCCEVVRFQAEKKGIELLLNIHSKTPQFANFDPTRLKQIIINLLSNSVKFTSAGEVELQVKYNVKTNTTGSFAFSIKDTGIGISKEQQKKLFKSFSQADSSTTRKFGGTGLGLVISQMLAKKMGSEIKIDSKENHGSKFYFDIESTVEYSHKNVIEFVDKKLHCLIIDDNKSSRSILKDNLEKYGIKVKTCENGFDSLKIIEENGKFDLIIVDYHMPYINGIETVELIQKKLHLDPSKQKIILLHSCSDNVDIHSECEKLGISYAITKPVKSNNLEFIVNVITDGDSSSNATIDKTETIIEKDIVHDTSAHILLVEDNSTNMLLAKSLIKTIVPHVTITEASNGKAAIEAVKLKKFDLIFMDVQMPEMDGNEATRVIRKIVDKSLCSIPIIGLSAGVLEKEKEQCLNSGMDDFLTKPIEIEKLKASIKKFCFDCPHEQAALQKESTYSEDVINDSFHFDKASLLKRVLNDKILFRKLITVSLIDFPKEMNRLLKAYNTNDICSLSRSLHTIKGTSKSMNFNRLITLATEMESSIKEENFCDYIMEIENEWIVVEKLLRSCL